MSFSSPGPPSLAFFYFCWVRRAHSTAVLDCYRVSVVACRDQVRGERGVESEKEESEEEEKSDGSVDEARQALMRSVEMPAGAGPARGWTTRVSGRIQREK